jgi:cell division protein FtsI/penicillin-binding protein 2
VGIDNQGLCGLEYRFDTLLKGSPGKIRLEGDTKGHRMITGYKKVLDSGYDGGNIITTLDEFTQYITQKHLKEGIEHNMALGGIAIVMDPQTGEILAMSSAPEFNPNDWNQSHQANLKNTAIVDVYEPGSIFKLITMSAALEEGLANPNEVIYVPETIEVGGKRIKEAHPREPGETDRRTVSEILEKSLNVGTTLLAKRLGPKKFYEYIEKFRFGKKTHIELPGESKGLLRHVSKWSGSDIGTISFGQGVAVTPIQMIAGAAAIVNGGEWVKPKIIDRITYHDNQSIKGSPQVTYPNIIHKDTAKKVVTMMVKTVESGTGEIVKIPGYWIGGKTGTAQKPNPNGLGYLPGRYIASFIGFFPAYSPKYIILIVVDTPRRSIYGSSVAGPIFKNIAKDLILYKNIPPDYTPSTK